MLQDLCDVTRSINFTKSEDGDSDCCFSPTYPLINAQKIKCPKCYGTNAFNCNQCSGTQKVSDNHPLAMLLNSVLLKKINARKPEEREEIEPVETIKEVEEECEDKRLVCSFCQTQCEYSSYTCPQCPNVSLCEGCSSRKWEHNHWLGQPMTTSIGLSSSKNEEKHCFNCSKQIQNCYSICLTCQQNHINFWVCDVCSDESTFVHQSQHVMETVMDYDTFKDKLDTYSEQFQEQIEKISVKSEKEEVRERKELKLKHKNSSIVHVLENGEESPMMRGTSDEDKRNQDQISRVRFQLDGLFSSYDFNQSMKSKNILRPPTRLKQEGFSCNVSEASKSKEKHGKGSCEKYDQKQNKSVEDLKEYTFFGYKCDICEVHPIKNVRHHCRQCEDFDVCNECYKDIEQSHEHTDFDRVIGKEIREKVLERMSNCRDLKVSANLRATIVANKATPQRHKLRSKTHRFNTLLS